MRVNEENVLKEMKSILSIMDSAYLNSKSDICDRELSKAMGKLDTLIKILSNTNNDWIAIQKRIYK